MTTETERVSGRLGAACPSGGSWLHHLDCLLKRSRRGIMVALQCFESKEEITVLTLAFRLYHSLTTWSAQRQGELELISVKISKVHPVGSQGLASISKIQQSFPEQPRGQSIHPHQLLWPPTQRCCVESIGHTWPGSLEINMAKLCALCCLLRAKVLMPRVLCCWGSPKWWWGREEMPEMPEMRPCPEGQDEVCQLEQSFMRYASR